MDEKSLEMLEFHRVREMLAEFTSFSASREMALDLRCSSDPDHVSLLLQQCREGRELLSREPGFTIGQVFDARGAAVEAARGHVLDPEILVAIAEGLAAVRRLRARLREMSSSFPLLWAMAESITPFRELEADITRCLSPAGEVLDSASPRLAAIRRQQKTTRRHLLERLEAIIRSPRGKRIVQEPIVTERQGRYVIPIKAESQRDIRGIIHDVSNTGATVFVEPWTTVEAGNELRQLVLEEEREVERILRDLSEQVGAHQEAIRGNVALAAEIDLALARARFARKYRAMEPELTSWGESPARGMAPLRLVDARHPLLGDKAVPLSLEMGRDFSVLVITGPNAGGKTVALKTVGLLSLMAQAGMPIPASEGSRLPVFDAVFVDIGDEQSIERTLSTFSWHMGNIIGIIGRASSRSLVLLDELGVSTDPAQGSALARAILLHFLSVGALTVATTHYSDLKAFAHLTPGLKNASLDFDPLTLAPTYRLRVGVPGGSNTLATAARLGLPESISEAARGMLARGSDQLNALLADLAAERRHIERLRDELDQERRQLKEREADLEVRLHRLAVRERALIQEVRDRVVRQAAALQKDIRQAAAQLRRERSREAIEQGRQTLATIRQRLRGEEWQAQPETQPVQAAPGEDSIAPGDTVWLKDASIPATVLSVSEKTGQVQAQAGSTTVNVGIEGVTKVDPAGRQGGRRPPAVTVPERRQQVPQELHLLGKRVGEALQALESYLDAAALSGLAEVRIVHGSGTGALRTAVRELLGSHPLVRSFRPGQRGEGGNGVTIVAL